MRTQLKINGEMKNVEIENGEITILKKERVTNEIEKQIQQPKSYS